MGAALLIVSLSACGASSGNGPSPQATSGELTDVTVGFIPVLDTAPLYIGIDKGFFEEEGLNVHLQASQSGAAILPAVLNNEYQFGSANNLTILAAANEGLPVRIVAASTTGGSSEEDSNLFISVVKDSPAQRPKDLEGKTVAINALKNLGELGVRKAVQNDGGDPSRVNFVEVAFPDMPNLLLKGDIDAAWLAEPFAYGVRNDVRHLFALDLAIAPNLAFGSMFTTQSYIDAHPDTVAAFQRAMVKTLSYAKENLEEVRDVLSSDLGQSPDVAQNVPLSPVDEKIHVETLEMLSKDAVNFGILEKTPDLNTLLHVD